MVMLAVAAPFLLARETPRVIMSVGIGVIVVASVAYMFGATLPLLSRLGEIDNANTSEGERVLVPAIRFAALVFDPSYIFSGDGGGAITKTELSTIAGNPGMLSWPILKLIYEYGLLAMVSFPCPLCTSHCRKF